MFMNLFYFSFKFCILFLNKSKPTIWENLLLILNLFMLINY